MFIVLYMTIIVNSELLTDLLKNNTITILKKRQKDSNDSNYYFTPNIGLNLWNAKIMFINSKFLVLEFNKIDHINLLTLLRYVDSSLQKLLKSKNSELFNVDIYSIMSETEDKFTIRCYLPNYRGKYLIKYYVNDSDELFKLPKLNSIIDNCVIEIRNVWGKNNKYGFNIELKSIKYIM